MVGDHHRFIARPGPEGVELIRDFEGMYGALDDPHGQRLSAANLAHGVYEDLIAAAVAQVVRPRAGGARLRYLDMGCGLGFFTERVRDRLQQGGALEAHGADIAASAVRRARDRTTGIGFHEASLLDAVTLAPLGRFHVVTCLETLYYFEEEEVPEVIRHLEALVAPGGVLATSYHLPPTMSYGRYVRALPDLRGLFKRCRPLWEMDFVDAVSRTYDGSPFGRHLFAIYEVPSDA